MSSRVGLEEPGSPPWISTPRPHASSNDTVFQVGWQQSVGWLVGNDPLVGWLATIQGDSSPNFQSSSQGDEGRRLDERSRTKSESRGRSAEDSSMSRGRSAEDSSMLRGKNIEEGGLVRGKSAEDGGMLDLLRSDIRTPRRPLEVIEDAQKKLNVTL